jgi:uncharacterized protein YhbP (UPF0306 family)
MPEKRIVNFIKEHHLLTLATSKENLSYCANGFYIYDEKIQGVHCLVKLLS